MGELALVAAFSLCGPWLVLREARAGRRGERTLAVVDVPPMQRAGRSMAGFDEANPMHVLLARRDTIPTRYGCISMGPYLDRACAAPGYGGA